MTALLQHVTADSIKEACGTEHCQDTPDYLRAINAEEYRTKKTDMVAASDNSSQLFIVALDVQGLYPNSPRKYVLDHLEQILETDFNPAQVHYLVTATKYCLEHTILAVDNEPRMISEGILTGASNSTGLADAFLTVITRPIRASEFLLIFKRYIDDIIAHFIGSYEQLKDWIKSVEERFLEFDMKIDARIAGFGVDGVESEAEFLDVNHKFTGRFDYETVNFVKPTALGRVFLDGSSYHPMHIFKGIVAGESKRMRRLNSTESGYKSSLADLQTKCKKSNFHMPVVKDQLKTVREKDMGQDKALDQTDGKEDFDKIIWATSVPQLIKINENYQQLIHGDTQIQTVYKRPAALRTRIPAFHYNKIINPSKNEGHGQGKSAPCGNCKCCGGYGAKVKMVNESAVSYTSSNQPVRLRQILNCKDAGIYQLRCKACIANDNKTTGTYVGMTKNGFNERMAGHRSNFKNNIKFDLKNADRYALARHYKTAHPELQLPTFEEAFELIFLEKPADMNQLRLSEDTWANRLEANLNVQKMVTTKVKF